MGGIMRGEGTRRMGQRVKKDVPGGSGTLGKRWWVEGTKGVIKRRAREETSLGFEKKSG